MEIEDRGVDDVCIVVCDGLKGRPESVAATWPLAWCGPACCT